MLFREMLNLARRGDGAWRGLFNRRHLIDRIFNRANIGPTFYRPSLGFRGDYAARRKLSIPTDPMMLMTLRHSLRWLFSALHKCVRRQRGFVHNRQRLFILSDIFSHGEEGLHAATGIFPLCEEADRGP